MEQKKTMEIMERLEKERTKLYLLVGKYGLESPLVLEQSKLIDSLLLALMKGEKQANAEENL